MEEKEIRCYTIQELLQFIGETGVQMDTKLKIAGMKDAYVYTLTFVPDDNALYFDKTKYKEVQ